MLCAKHTNHIAYMCIVCMVYDVCFMYMNHISYEEQEVHIKTTPHSFIQ